MSERIRCPYCFMTFKATRAMGVIRQRDDHVANAATRCVVYMLTHTPQEALR